MDIEEYAAYRQRYTGQAPALLLQYLSISEVKNFLDLGCGDGALLHALKATGYLNNKVVYAADLSETRMDLVKKIDPNFISLVRSVDDLKEIKDHSIDFLVSEQVIEHVENEQAMVKEIKRVLSASGTVYLSTVFKKWYGWYFYRCNGKWTLDPTHLREYAKDHQLLDIFNQHHLKVLVNKKTLIWRSLVDFILKRMNLYTAESLEFWWIKILRKIRVPVLGYYNWELVLKNA